MKQIRQRVAGLDVHRDSVVACTRSASPDGSVEVAKKQFSTTRKGLGELAGFLGAAGVVTVAMEATGVYWKCVYYALEGLVPELWLCNAQHVKNVPGRKTDLSDAEWLADVAAHGMVRPSFVPPPPVRELRELTRYRKTQVDARGHEVQRLEKVLQDAMAVGHEGVDEALGDGAPGHPGSLLCVSPSVTTVLWCTASSSISPSFLVAAARVISRPLISPSQPSCLASSIRARRLSPISSRRGR